MGMIRGFLFLSAGVFAAAGLLTVPSGTHAIRWLPPLNVARAEVDEAVEILRATLARLVG